MSTIQVLIKLYVEFFKTGLFAVGGGLATLPFLKNIGETTGWFTSSELMNMIAVSESTPGPIGINMATYVGFTCAGIPGVIAATIGEVTPSIIVILIIAVMLNKFKSSKAVQNMFYGLRPASTALMTAAWISIVLTTLTNLGFLKKGIVSVLTIDASRPYLSIVKLILAAAIWLMTNKIKATKKLHPIVPIIVCAVCGIVLRLGGA